MYDEAFDVYRMLAENEEVRLLLLSCHIGFG